MKGSPMARNYGPPFKHSTEKVFGKEQPVGPHSHPGEQVVAQGADVDDLESEFEMEDIEKANRLEDENNNAANRAEYTKKLGRTKQN